MRVNRRFLNAGLFLVAVGGVIVAADQGLLGSTTLTDVVRLWPVAVIAIGVGLVLRRTRLGLAGGLVAAAVPGLVLGSAFAAVPRFAGSCGTNTEPALITTSQGTFSGPQAPSIYVSTGCGTLDVRMGPPDEWRLDAGNSTGRTPDVLAGEQSLAIDVPGKPGWQMLERGRDRWTLTLPTSGIEALELRANANHARLDLTGAEIGVLEIVSNASDVTLDATWARVANVVGTVNAGSMSVRLPNADQVDSFRVNVGDLEICAPPDLGLSISSRGAFDLTVAGVSIDDRSWESANYGSATYNAELDVRVNLGSVSVNPIGGCR